mgnify:CR=1 FL=1
MYYLLAESTEGSRSIRNKHCWKFKVFFYPKLNNIYIDNWSLYICVDDDDDDIGKQQHFACSSLEVYIQQQCSFDLCPDIFCFFNLFFVAITKCGLSTCPCRCQCINEIEPTNKKNSYIHCRVTKYIHLKMWKREKEKSTTIPPPHCRVALHLFAL